MQTLSKKNTECVILATKTNYNLTNKLPQIMNPKHKSYIRY